MAGVWEIDRGGGIPEEIERSEWVCHCLHIVTTCRKDVWGHFPSRTNQSVD